MSNAATESQPKASPAGDDGMPGDDDTVCAAVASVAGTEFADGLVAGSGPAELVGEGADTLNGGTGTDDRCDYDGLDTVTACEDVY
ncbi:MAG TPA: hypothetical protein VK659_31955 [Asanoa sp.]|nr:hypothetical protein [Asanoa sp.]